MQLKLTEDKTRSDIEVEIKYPEYNEEVKSIKQHVKSLEKVIIGNDNGRQFRINIVDIYYVESVERKVFIYTKDKVYRSELKLYMFLEELPKNQFVRVSKSCILNINVLVSIQTLFNSKLEATLMNGEKICISRTYIPLIKQLVFGGEKI